MNDAGVPTPESIQFVVGVDKILLWNCDFVLLSEALSNVEECNMFVVDVGIILQ